MDYVMKTCGAVMATCLIQLMLVCLISTVAHEFNHANPDIKSYLLK